LLSFLALAVPGYIPSVDLPQHARLVALIVQHTGVGGIDVLGYEFNFFSPYWIFYLLSSLVYVVVGDPLYASQIALALLSAGIIPASAGLLFAIGSRPVYALFTVFAVFSEVVGWGFVGMIAATPFLLLLLMFCEMQYRSPRPLVSGLIAGSLPLLYFSHVLFWCLGVLIVAVFYVLKPYRVKLVIPVAVSALVTLLLLVGFMVTFRKTDYFSIVSDTLDVTLKGRILTNLDNLWGHFIHYGVPYMREPLLKVLLSLYGITFLLGILVRDRSPSESSMTFRERVYQYRYGIAVTLLIIVQVFTPDYFLISRRIPLFVILLMPLLLKHHLKPIVLAPLFLSLLVCLGVIHGAWLSARFFSANVQCLDDVIYKIDRPGRSLALIFDRQPRDYGLPVKQQIIGFLSSRKGGRPFMDFVFSGVGPIRPKDLKTIPDKYTILMHLDARLYHPIMSDQYDTIITSPPIDPRYVVADKLNQFTLALCRDFSIFKRKDMTRQ
jgi:hypothetical protein